MTDQSVTINLKNEYGEHTIISNDPLHNINDFVDSLIRPLLLSMGYQPDNVNAVLDTQFYSLDDEIAYSVGDEFVSMDSDYRINKTVYELRCDNNLAGLYNLRTGMSYKNIINVVSETEITQDEFDEIIGVSSEIFYKIERCFDK